VIGDVVNVTARLQGVSRQFPRTPLLIPESSVRQLATADLFEFWRLGEFHLKGKAKLVSTYAVVGNNTNYPSDFTIFDDLPYSRTDALLACYLYCQGYTRPVIAEALQVGEAVVARWCEIASQNAMLVGEILVVHYQVPKSCRYRLREAISFTDFGPANREGDDA
jgi:hypothetical protein